jgi:hypothetical protein
LTATTRARPRSRSIPEGTVPASRRLGQRSSIREPLAGTPVLPANSSDPSASQPLSQSMFAHGLLRVRPLSVWSAADTDGEVPASWLAVLDAVAEACAAERIDYAPTDVVSRRIRSADGSRKARTLLRLLRRRGYVCARPNSKDGAPVRWALTSAGRSLRIRRRDTSIAEICSERSFDAA